MRTGDMRTGACSRGSADTYPDLLASLSNLRSCPRRENVATHTLCARLGEHLRCLVCVAGEATGAGARAWCAFLMCAA